MRWLNLNELVAATCFDKYDEKTDRSNKGTIVVRLTRKLKTTITEKRVFPGYHLPVWVVSLTKYIELVHFLALYNARFKQYSEFINKTFQRVLAGDQALHTEIDANANSNHPLNRMARDELANGPTDTGGPAIEDPTEKEPDKKRVTGGDEDHPLMKRSKLLHGVVVNHHAVFDDRVNATREIVLSLIHISEPTRPRLI
eukprot:3509953-Rhodomonas_salina.1